VGGIAQGRPATPSGEWTWWDQAVLRAPGFPADGVLRLAAPGLAEAADRLAGAAGEMEDRWRTFSEAHRRAVADVGAELQAVAAGPRFQEAVAWQNRHALETGIAPLLRRRPGGSRDRKQREHEELVASYWQRYCVKNDSVGFFGPIGWGRLDAGGATSCVPGPRLTASCEVYFETWAIDALAARIVDDPSVRPWLVPKRAPYVRLTGLEVRVPTAPPVEVTPAEAAVLAACDGRRTVREVVASVVADGAAASERDALATLDSLVTRRWVATRLEIPIGVRPERALRAALEAIGDGPFRRRALRDLDRLVAPRDAAAAAAGDPRAVVAALAELDSVFEELTERRARRHHGKAYAGRTIVYRDCRRDVEVVLGTEVLEALRPLELLLRSGRWLTYRVGEAVRGRLLELHRGLVRSSGDRRIDLSAFWFEAMPMLHAETPGVVEAVAAEAQEHWSEILGCSLDDARVRSTFAELDEEVAAAFDAPAPGWAGARYASPDVLLAAPDVDAIRAGRFEAVLGDFHLAINALRHACFVAQHPDPEELVRCVDADFPEPRLLPVLAKDSPPRLTTRLHSALGRGRDLYVVLSEHSVDARSARVLLAADLDVAEAGGRVVVRAGSAVFDVLDVFSEILTGFVFDGFSLFGRRPHSPRVTIDRLVSARETWRFAAAELAFAAEPDEARRFAGARAWWRAAGLPRHVFAKSALEEKPFYVDFESPVYVRVLAKAVRRLLRSSSTEPLPLTLVEMLPAFEDAWLVDASGARYTSEIRLVAVDARRPVAPRAEASTAERRVSAA
jgi:hypothetical protein